MYCLHSRHTQIFHFFISIYIYIFWYRYRSQNNRYVYKSVSIYTFMYRDFAMHRKIFWDLWGLSLHVVQDFGEETKRQKMSQRKVSALYVVWSLLRIYIKMQIYWRKAREDVFRGEDECLAELTVSGQVEKVQGEETENLSPHSVVGPPELKSSLAHRCWTVLGGFSRSTCRGNWRQKKNMLCMFKCFKIMYGHGLGVTTRKTFGRLWERCAANTSKNTTPHEPRQKKQLKTDDWCCRNLSQTKLV